MGALFFRRIMAKRRKKKLTKKQKVKMNPQGKGNSEYARKFMRRPIMGNVNGQPARVPKPLLDRGV